MPDPLVPLPSTMPQWFAQKLDSWWKIGGILGSAIALGLTSGFALAAIVTLPSVVEANEAGIASNIARIETLESQMLVMQSDSAELKDDLNERLDRVECLVIASRRDTPIEDCL